MKIYIQKKEAEKDDGVNCKKMKVMKFKLSINLFWFIIAILNLTIL